MKIEEAVEILKRHNEWRRGGDGEMQDPKILGVAIDKAVEVLSKNFGRNSKLTDQTATAISRYAKMEV